MVSTAAVRPVPAAVVPRPAACAPIPFTSVSAMKLSLSRFIARRITGSGGEVADPIWRAEGGVTPTVRPPTCETPTPFSAAFTRCAAAIGGLVTYAARALPV